MFFTILSLYFIMTISWCILAIYINRYLLIGLPILWYSIHYYFYYTSINNPSQHHTYPIISSVYKIYEQFKEGDIVFTKDYNSFGTLDKITQYFNKGVAHASVVVIENGVKYFINSVPDANQPKNYILKKYTYMGSKWLIIKEPLLDFILKYKCIYQIYRHKKPNIIQYKNNFTPTYCSQVIGNILYKTNMIKNSSYIIAPYTPENLIELLIQRGYKYFYFKHV